MIRTGFPTTTRASSGPAAATTHGAAPATVSVTPGDGAAAPAVVEDGIAAKAAHETTELPLAARPHQGGRRALDVRLDEAVASGAARGALRRKLLVEREERRTTPTFPGRADLPPQERLRAMTAGAARDGDPLVMQQLRMSPSAAMRTVEETLGRKNARHLSAEEAARGIGAPGLARTIAVQLARPMTAGGVPPISQQPGAPHYALALKLADAMERMYAGATRDEVIQFLHAQQPDLMKLFPYLDASFLGALQRVYVFMPQWDVKPAAPVAHDPDVFKAISVEEANAARVRDALRVAAEIPLAMPLTSSVADELAEKQVFKGRRVVMVQHMLGQAVPFVHAMMRAGLDPSKAQYVGVPYQENPAVAHALRQGYGVDVQVAPRGDIDAMYRTVGTAIDRALKDAGPDEKIVVIDDGGYASKWIHEHHPDQAHRFQLVEQTTRGLTEISKLDDPQFPIVNVAGSFGKRFESGQIGDVVVHAVRKVLDAVTTTPARKDVLVVGAGKVGAAVAQSFKGDGARVSIFDPFIGKARKRELEAQGYRVITDKEEALRGKFLVVGASGHRSIDMNDFVKMSSPVFIASASSKKVEIDMLGLEKSAVDAEGKLRRVLAAQVGEQETWHYWLKDGRIVTAMADGLPVNFQGVNSVAPELIDHTMALMLMGAGRAATATGKGLVELDEAEQWRLQARMEGVAQAGHEAEPGALAISLYGETYWATPQQMQAVAASGATPPAVRHAIYGLASAMTDARAILDACFAPDAVFAPAMIDDVVRRGDLTDIAKLLFHEAVDFRTQHKILLHLFDVALDLEVGAFGGEKAADVRAPRTNARGVTRWAVGGAFTWEGERRFLPASEDARAHFADQHDDPSVQRFLRERDYVLEQVRSLLLSHPQSMYGGPAHMFRRDAVDAFLQVGGVNVLGLRHKDFTTSQLDAMYGAFEKAAEVLLSPAPAVAGVAARALKERVAYVHDVLETFRDHENASDRVKIAALRRMSDLEKQWDDVVWFAPTDDWPKNGLGIQYPEYG